MECRVDNGQYLPETDVKHINYQTCKFRTETIYTNKSGRTVYLYTSTGIVLPVISECNGNDGLFNIRKSYTFASAAATELSEYFNSVNPAINSELGALKEAFECLIKRLGERISIVPEIQIVINFSARLEILFEGNYLHLPDMNIGLSFSSKATNISINTPFDYKPNNKEIERTIVNHKEFNLDVKFIDNNDEKGNVFFTVFGKLWNIRGSKDLSLKNGLYYVVTDSEGLIVRDGNTFTREPVFIPIEELANNGIYSNREAALEFKLAQNEEAIRQSVIKQMEVDYKEKEYNFKEKERHWDAESKRAEREFKDKEYAFKEKEREWNEEVRQKEREFKDREYAFKDKINGREYIGSFFKNFTQIFKELATIAAVAFGAYKLWLEIQARRAAI